MEALILILIVLAIVIYRRKKKKGRKPQQNNVEVSSQPIRIEIELPKTRAIYARQFFQCNVMDYVAFDTETTGVNVTDDRIVEIAAVRVRKGKPVKTFTTLVNPGCQIPESASSVNHITNKMIAKAPNTSSALKKFFEFAENDILVGHNAARFDGPLLMAEADRCGISFSNSFSDSLIMAKIYYPFLKSKRLESVCEHVGHKQKKAHRALDDSESVVAIVEAMRNEYKKNPNA